MSLHELIRCCFPFAHVDSAAQHYGVIAVEVGHLLDVPHVGIYPWHAQLLCDCVSDLARASVSARHCYQYVHHLLSLLLFGSAKQASVAGTVAEGCNKVAQNG